MREIKFRAKSLNGVWEYGELHIKNCRIPHIHTDVRAIINIEPKTVGQFIGIKDSKGMEIYEGDILEYYNKITKKSHLSGLVIYNEHAAAFNVVNPENGHYLYIKPTDDGIDETLTIIGNIHDNPELMEANNEPDTI